ncbi:MAG: sigma-70 family RNA polymerase sigma factor [Bacteroidales bacterium]|nr:sigma-70 family RNA polymerase sigma factor [Bacteroidales bacterium]
MIDEQEILSLIADPVSREKGFTMMVQKYQQRLYWHLRRMLIDHDDTDDALQNTLINAWRALPKFRQDSQLYTWLYRIATNEALSFIKNSRKHLLHAYEEGGQEISDLVETSSGISGDEISIKLQKAVLRLPAKQRLVFNMKYFDEMKYADIAEVLGTSVGALKASYHLAVKKIEKLVMQD